MEAYSMAFVVPWSKKSLRIGEKEKAIDSALTVSPVHVVSWKPQVLHLTADVLNGTVILQSQRRPPDPI